MDYVEVEGTSIDDAIARALQRLGVERDRVEIEIVSNASRGLFGLGGRRAVVRATLRSPLNLESAPSPTVGAAPAVATPGLQRDDRPAVERAPESAAQVPDARILEQARAILEQIARMITADAQVEIARDADGVRLVITGDSSGVLIGRRGQTLDALEYLINRIAGRDEDGVTHIAVDSQDYRARRREALVALAARVAERARRRGKTVTLNPMSPRDRRIVHLALRGDPSLITRSSGKGYFRKLLVIPEASRKGGRIPGGENGA